MDVLTVVVGQGMFLMGRLDGKKLFKPRIISTFNDEKDGGKPKINLSPLPLLPPFIIVSDFFGTYPVPSREKNIIELYERVTHMSVDPGTM